MGQYTSRINNPNQNTTSTTQNTQVDSTSLASNTSIQSTDQSHSSTLAPATRTLSNSRITNLRRRRSSTNYTNAHLPASRRRRLPRLNETIRFWNRRTNQSTESLDFDDVLSTELSNDLSLTPGNNGVSIFPSLENDQSTTPFTRISEEARDILDISHELRSSTDIAERADRASDVFSSRSNHHSRPNLRQHSSFSSIPSSNSANSTHQRDSHDHENSTINSSSLSFEHQTEMLSRLLEMAATSTLMNLMGSLQVNGRRFDNTSRAQSNNVLNNNINTIPTDGHDSNFQEFVNALRHGLLTNELSSRYSDLESNRGRNMTFFRAFRFDSETRDNENSNTGTTNTTTDSFNSDNSYSDLDDGPFSFFSNRNRNRDSPTTNNADAPNVPVMIIGVRSVEQNSSGTLNSLSTAASGATAVRASTTTTSDSTSPTQQSDSTESQATDSSSGSTNNSQPRQRSWVIFVMGNNFAWNHPLLTAPSLMSENPTYEDLLNLQELIGQVKPQVTTREELYKHSDQLYEVNTSDAELKTNYGSIKVDPLDRCQICLSEYENNEIVRKLSNCNHFYHRDCVDNWLLNGKNSCPLCRSKGILTTDEGEVDADTTTTDNVLS